jgi:hypothetical protein
VAGVIVDRHEDIDGLVYDVQHDPLGFVAGELAVLEHPAAQFVTDPAVLAGFGERAVASQLPDFLVAHP